MNKHIEDDIQSEYFRLCALLKIFAWATPNGGKRNAREGARLKKQGVLAGVADVFIPSNCDQSAKGLFIEFKAPKGRVEPSQKLFESIVRERGYVYIIFRGSFEAINYTLRFLGRPERLQNIRNVEI
jgi:hypothetical protein